MKISVNGGAHTLAPGKYEERETDNDRKRRAVPPELRRGNPEIVREQYAYLQKQREAKALYVSGVLTWTETLDRVKPHEDEVMDDFEEMMFARVDPCRFGRLWYRHLDKGKVELHWSFLAQDLVTGKLVSLYYRDRDWAMFEMCQERINRRYGFTSPFEPKRRRLFKISYKSPSVRQRARFELARTALESLFVAWPANREESCARLDAVGWAITERGKHFLTVSSEQGAYYLGGAFCHEAFTGPEYVTKVIGGWTKMQQDILGSPEVIERHYQRLFEWRANHLNHFLAAHTPRFGLGMSVLSATVSVSNAIADIDAALGISPSADPIGDSLSVLNNETALNNYEHPDAKPDPAGREILDRAHRCVEELGSQIQRVIQSAENAGGTPGQIGAANRRARGQRKGRKRVGAGPDELEAYWEGLRQRREQLQTVGTPNAPTREFSESPTADAPSLAAIDELQRKIVRCINGISAEISTRQRDAEVAALRTRLESATASRGPDKAQPTPAGGVLTDLRTHKSPDRPSDGLPPGPDIS